MEKIEEAQEVGKRFMELEEGRKNFQNQKSILKFQDVLVEMALLISSDSDPPQKPEDEKKPTIVRRFTKSLVEVEEIHSCSVCEKQYQSFKSLGKHHRQKHPNEAPLSFKQYTNRNAVICLAAKKNFPKLQCRKQVEKVRFVRHLKEVHSIEKPANKEFRGFTYTCSVSNPPDDKEIKYSVCWRSRTEYNPPDEELIEATSEVEQENNGQTLPLASYCLTLALASLLLCDPLWASHTAIRWLPEDHPLSLPVSQSVAFYGARRPRTPFGNIAIEDWKKDG